MDSELLKNIFYVLVVGAIILGFVRIASKPKKCSVCGIDSNNAYRDEKDTSIPLCRTHLVERWKKEFVLSKYEMIVIEPDFIHYPYGYLYATIEKLKEWQYNKYDLNNVSAILNKINGKKCKECGSDATVAYFNKEDYSFPYLEKIKSEPGYLCKNCVIKKVEPLLRSSPEDFLEGVYAPTNDKGVYHVQEF